MKRTNALWMLIAMLVLSVGATCPEDDLDEADADTEPETDAVPDLDPPGSDCSCDAECAGEPGHAAICVFGVCMLRPAMVRDCAGQRRTCPPSMQLREVYEYGGFVCYPECGAFECEGDCDRYGACIDTEDTDFWCNRLCASYCSDDD